MYPILQQGQNMYLSKQINSNFQNNYPLNEIFQNNSLASRSPLLIPAQTVLAKSRNKFRILWMCLTGRGYQFRILTQKRPCVSAIL